MEPNLLKVLELLSQYDKPDSELQKYRAYTDFRGKNQINLGRDYSIVAKKCLVNQRFAAAATMLDIVCQEISMDELFFFKAASVVLENNPNTTNEEFFYFIRHVIILDHINKREVILEYLIRSLRKQDLDGQHNIKVLMSNQRKNVLRNFLIDPLLKVYLGMYDYLEWARGCQGDLYEIDSKVAEKAIEIFREAIEVPGQWDIFVFKLVEMLEFYDRIEEMGAVLRKYVEMNPEHINSYLYLCWYLRKYKSSLDNDELINCLKTLSKLSPSDTHVLLLVDLIKEAQPEKSLKLLFSFLDYPSNAENIDAWKSLLDLLIYTLESQSPSTMKTMNSCWRKRYDVWLYIHFNHHNQEEWNKKYSKLALYKSAVLCVFLEDHRYVQTVIEKLPGLSKKLFERFIDKVSYIEYLKESSSSESCDESNHMQT